MIITIVGTKSIVEIQNPETCQNMSDVPPSLGGHTTKLSIRLPASTTLEQVHLRMTFPYDFWESATQSHYPPTIHTPCNDFDVAQVILHAIFHKVLANISQSGLWSHNTNPFATKRSVEGLPNPKPPSKQGEPRLRLTNKYWTAIWHGQPYGNEFTCVHQCTSATCWWLEWAGYSNFPWAVIQLRKFLQAKLNHRSIGWRHCNNSTITKTNISVKKKMFNNHCKPPSSPIRRCLFHSIFYGRLEKNTRLSRGLPDLDSQDFGLSQSAC